MGETFNAREPQAVDAVGMDCFAGLVSEKPATQSFFKGNMGASPHDMLDASGLNPQRSAEVLGEMGAAFLSQRGGNFEGYRMNRNPDSALVNALKGDFGLNDRQATGLAAFDGMPLSHFQKAMATLDASTLSQGNPDAQAQLLSEGSPAVDISGQCPTAMPKR